MLIVSESFELGRECDETVDGEVVLNLRDMAGRSMRKYEQRKDSVNKFDFLKTIHAVNKSEKKSINLWRVTRRTLAMVATSAARDQQVY